MGKNMTKQQQYVVVGVVFLILGLWGYWNYLLNPVMVKITKNEAKYRDLVGQIEKAKRQARRLPALKNQKEKLELELKDMERQLPKGKDMPNILRTITREALRENLDFKSVFPEKTRRKQYFESIPFKLQMTGNLHSFIRFLASLGQQERIFSAGKLDLRPVRAGDSGVIDLNINVMLETYAYNG